ncbi:hypothetical protein QYF36_014799 [Acer negundo]|nr:hypothetical protein QYF36_014799 [Acer negundo]
MVAAAYVEMEVRQTKIKYHPNKWSKIANNIPSLNSFLCFISVFLFRVIQTSSYASLLNGRSCYCYGWLTSGSCIPLQFSVAGLNLNP